MVKMCMQCCGSSSDPDACLGSVTKLSRKKVSSEIKFRIIQTNASEACKMGLQKFILKLSEVRFVAHFFSIPGHCDTSQSCFLSMRDQIFLLKTGPIPL